MLLILSMGFDLAGWLFKIGVLNGILLFEIWLTVGPCLSHSIYLVSSCYSYDCDMCYFV